MDHPPTDSDHSFWLSLAKRRILGTTKISLAGLKACYRSEEAFRIEVILALLLTPLAVLLADSHIEFLFLFTTIALVLIVELLNSAVEATVDRISLEQHELSKQAKDIGSAAVFVSLMLFLVVWVTVVLF